MIGDTPSMTAAEWRKLMGLAPIGADGLAQHAKSMRSKFGNHVVNYQGVRYHSKAELEMEMQLRTLTRLEKVLFHLRQVPFAMPADDNTEKVERYLLDFLVVQPAPYSGYKGLVVPRYVDVKGFLEGKSKTKIRTIEATYHINIELVKREDIASWI